MQDCMNREQMELASASTSAAVPAATRRGPVAALIAAVIVAAALLFAMPSLAYASNEASGGSQGTESQEILLSRSDSSTSVNKTPDEPKAPPAYTAQDAYKSTPQSTGSGVEVVNGAGDSSDKSYTPGDDKSSINDKDSDSDSDSASNSGTNGTEDTDDSTSNEGQDPSDPKDNDDSTDKNNGAISDSTDEIATDKNQSAHPTGDDSKADDVIATPGDKGSADQNAGATSVKTEEVKQQTSISSQNGITTQASGKVTVHFGTGWTPNVVTSMSSTPQATDIYTNFRDKKVWGNASDPVFDSNGNRLFYGGTAITAGSTISIDASEAAGLNITNPTKLFGYTGTQWLFIVKQDVVNGSTGAVTTRYRKVPGTFASVLNDRSYQNGFWTTIDAYPIYETAPITVLMYFDNAEKGSFGGYINEKVVTIAHSNPSNSKLVWTISPDSQYHPEAITQKKYYTDAEFTAGVTHWRFA